jgi:hypothetical protein
VQVSSETQLAINYKLFPFATGSQDVIAFFFSYRSAFSNRKEVF